MPLKVELFSSPGCQKCRHARALLQELVDELGENSLQPRYIDVVEELDRAVELGVLSIPAIAIDNELVFSTLPSRERLRSELLERVHRLTAAGHQE